MTQHYPPSADYPPHPPPQWQPQSEPTPPPVPVPPKKRSHGKLAAVLLLVFGLMAACALTSNKSAPAPQVPATPAGSTATAAAPAVVDPAPAAAEPAVTVADAPLQPARKITTRDWQLIAKNPGQHAGERIVVYGEVMQFDASTGTTGFRGNVDGVVHKPEYGYADYKTNTILTGDDAALTDVVENDLFKAEVTVAGSKSYETTMGGTLTVPNLTVTKIDVIGHAK